MKKNSESKGVSRRKFIKGFSTGVVGSTLLPHALSADAEQKKKKAVAPHKDKIPVSLKVNGKQVNLLIEPMTTLADLLRNHLKLTGTKVVCNHGECGGCTVILDGKAVYSCHILALDAADKEVTTIEGLLNGEQLHPLQEAFIEHDGFQCGFCTPGQIMSAQALLLQHSNPSKKQVKTAMSGNLCRCSAYPKIIDSVLAAVQKNSG